MKTIIHINKNLKQSDDKHGLDRPVCRVEVKGETWYGSAVDIEGPSKMIYRPNSPRACGAKLWIETEADVIIHDKVKYSEINKG